MSEPGEFNVSKETWAKIRRAGIETVADLLAKIGDPTVLRATGGLTSLDVQELNEALKRCDFETILIPVPILPLGSVESMPLPELLHARLVESLAALTRVSADLAEMVGATNVAPLSKSPSEGEPK
jgi:hypothetical protein